MDRMIAVAVSEVIAMAEIRLLLGLPCLFLVDDFLFLALPFLEDFFFAMVRDDTGQGPAGPSWTRSGWARSEDEDGRCL